MIDIKYIEQFGSLKTPFYFYDMDLLNKTIDTIIEESKKYNYVIHYAIKANSHPEIVRTIAKAEMGADCVSGNEIEYAIKHGISPSKIAFAGVGKTDDEIRTALKHDIFSFNCESIPEIEVINEIASQMNKTARIAIRINPDVDPKTHEYITTGLKDNKFGINHYNFDLVAATLKSMKNVVLHGIHFHIGSQITDMKVFEELSLKVNKIAAWFKENGFILSHLNVGGGLGINYENPEKEPIGDFHSYFHAFKELKLEKNQQLHFELGRSVVAQCGFLISRVLYVKKGIKTKFIILDGGMTELIRPALYKSSHAIRSLSSTLSKEIYDVVGPICESSDVFAKNIQIPKSKRGDLIAIHSAGAYGHVMASTYNMRDLVKEYTSTALD